MKRSKPKFITLRELRALCKEAGVEIMESEWRKKEWDILVDGHYIAVFEKDKRHCRRQLKAFCWGIIAMRKAGEI